MSKIVFIFFSFFSFGIIKSQMDRDIKINFSSSDNYAIKNNEQQINFIPYSKNGFTTLAGNIPDKKKSNNNGIKII